MKMILMFLVIMVSLLTICGLVASHHNYQASLAKIQMELDRLGK